MPKFVGFEVKASDSVMVKGSCGRIEEAADVSISDEGQDWKDQQGRKHEKTWVSGEIGFSPEATRQRAKEGLLALRMEAGLDTLEMVCEQELERSGSRHSHERRKIVPGGGQVEVSKAGARTVDNKEVRLKTYEAFKNDDP